MSSTEKKNSQQLLAEDHEALNALLRALITAFDQNDSAAIFARLDLFWARLAMHIRAENVHVFAAIVKAADTNLKAQRNEIFDPIEIRDAVKTLRRDHDFFMHELASAVNLVGNSLKTANELSRKELGKVREIIDRVVGRLKSHNQLEEESIYGLPARLLSTAEQLELAEQVRRELDNLPPRFHPGWQITTGP